MQADYTCRMPAREAVLSLGSNLGARLQSLEQARGLIGRHPDMRVTATSPIYETEPCGAPEAFAALHYLNMAVIVETSLPPLILSEAVHAVERAMGRRRGACPNLPRNIDIDIICHGEITLATPVLTLPHPRAHLRRFVLQPLSDLLPGLILPGQTGTVTDLLRGLPETPRVARWNYGLRQ
ncbi:MAG: 2-amino-4-hydroxy-6-hydroxymethyldihydropteridine diphosphokinase [Kiritimatiellae bacterium]|nr:2-amino-4-hydroxy-6-hydroxymethyldihydropteridine diphosphokinase [Kiritimatiellia bacterium]MDD3544207.1 2-amino-4-hydroxy-6-hydroxymethyldihydropteridine diphosphokinase [Kiritimatiellia bacterium]MDD4024797.1 2-amino-4-hydroxy-6-hydroxymethyldihydropteridine diphosphokinase [Kiritimatiellia bacterium]MDD4621880.1 2-amino-4-hydroxy-6-hydroxymethyldihydropteridine diphosphokinase [Kiritimatiellia bacterium]